MSEREAKPARIGALDSLRGLAVLAMLVYHLLFDLVAFSGAPEGLVANPVMELIRILFAGLFILLAGVSSRFSRNNWKRAGLLTLAAGAVSLAGWLVDLPIWFGVLHLLALSVFFYALGHRALEKLPENFAPLVYLLLAALGVFLTGRLNPVGADWLSPLGFHSAGYFSSDYYPLLPWFFFFLLGTWLGGMIQAKRLPERFYRFQVRPLSFLGRHSLLIYLVHQPVLYGLFWIFKK